jgi:transcription factor 1
MGKSYVYPCIKPYKHSDACTVHPELHFVTHIPQTIPGEQLVAQLFRSIPEYSWLFKYGRIPMSFLLPDWVWRVGSSLFFFPACAGRWLTLTRESLHRPTAPSDVN